MTRSQTRFLSALLGLVLSGCSGVVSYPTDWPERQTGLGEHCIIDGRYQNAPAAAWGATDLPLWDYLVNLPRPGMDGGLELGDDPLSMPGNIEVRIEQGREARGDYLDVKAYRNGLLLEARRLLGGKQFICSKHGIEITAGWSGLNLNLGFGMGRFRHVFNPGHSGGLIANVIEESRALAFFVLPLWEKRGGWVRWKAFAAASQEDQFASSIFRH